MATKILVVDDEVGIARALQRLLRGEFSVAVTTDATRALAMLDEFDPDIVISDYRMPGMDGAAFLAEVERLRPQALRILLTAHFDPDYEPFNSEQHPCLFGLMKKPWDNDELIKMLHNQLVS